MSLESRKESAKDLTAKRFSFVSARNALLIHIEFCLCICFSKNCQTTPLSVAAEIFLFVRLKTKVFSKLSSRRIPRWICLTFTDFKGVFAVFCKILKKYWQITQDILRSSKLALSNAACLRIWPVGLRSEHKPSYAPSPINANFVFQNATSRDKVSGVLEKKRKRLATVIALFLEAAFCM